MTKKTKSSLSILLFLVVVVAILHFQAKRIVIQLVESATSHNVEVKIKRLTLNPIRNSIDIQDIMVLNKEESGGFRKVTIKKAFLDVASLWNFFFGGTLVIEKLQCEGGEITLQSRTLSKDDATAPSSYDVNKIIADVKLKTIRFQIQDLAITDFNLTLYRDSVQSPTHVKQLKIEAQDLYLNADSVLKNKPRFEFSLPRQTIQFVNGLSVGFDSLFFSTTDNSIQLNNLALKSPDLSENKYTVNSDKVRVAHFDFETFYRKGILIIDSVFLGRSDLSVAWEIKSRSNSANTDSGHLSIPELIIKHLNVDQLASEIKLYNDSLENTFKIDNSYVTVEDFRHTPDSSYKVSARNYTLVLANYQTFLSKKHTAISFDTVRLQKYALSLLNFKLYNDDQVTPVMQTSVFELQQVDWYSLLFYKKLVAHKAVIINPMVYTTVKPGKSGQSANLVVVNSLREFLDVDLLSIVNATAYVKLLRLNADITLHGFNTTVRVGDLINSKSAILGVNAIDDFSFQSLQFLSSDIMGKVRNFSFLQGRTTVKDLDFHSRDRLAVSADGISCDKFNWDESLNRLFIDGLSWKYLEADVRNDEQKQTSTDSTTNTISVRLNKIKGANSKILYSKKELTLNALLKQINVESLQLGDTISVSGLDVRGGATGFHYGPLRTTIERFSISDQGGALDDIRLDRIAKDSLVASMDRIVFKADLQALFRNKIQLSTLDLQKISTSYHKRDSIQELKAHIENNVVLQDISYENEKLSIGSLLVEAGPFHFIHRKKVSNLEDAIRANKGKTSKFRLSIDSLLNRADTISHPKLRKVEGGHDFKANVVNPLYEVYTTSFQSERGLALALNQIETFKQDSATYIKANISSIKFDQLTVKDRDMNSQVVKGSVNNLIVNSLYLKDPWKILQDNSGTANIYQLKARIETGPNLFQFDRLDYDPKLAQVKINGFEFRPIKEKQTFLDESFYQTNYMLAKIDTISVQKLRINATDSSIRIGFIHVSAPSLEIDRDKTHPFYAKNIKLLPTNAFKRIGPRFKIDTIQLVNGKILYTEKSRITGQAGSMSFTNLNGLVRNVKNLDLKDGDSLYIRASTRFLDSAVVKLRVRESYGDTLAGFLMTTQVSPFNTSILNPALIPLVGVKFESGFVDTLQMRAVGREYLSLGSMKFLYRDLKVDFLNKNDTSKHSVKNILLKFAANKLVIKANNMNRIGTVYFERDRQRAVFQYWVKMILSGVTTSIGAKSDKKMIKKYQKELNQRGLPPINKELSDL